MLFVEKNAQGVCRVQMFVQRNALLRHVTLIPDLFIPKLMRRLAFIADYVKKHVLS